MSTNDTVAENKCKSCGSPTDTGWDGEPLELCDSCTKSVRNQEVEEEKARRKRKFGDPLPGEVKNTFKFSTIALLVAGGLGFLFLPMLIGIIILLSCWSYAYISYQRGEVTQPTDGSGAQVDVASEIEKLHELLKKGALTQEEFDAKKRSLLNQ